MDYKNFAFISYSHVDIKEAKRLEQFLSDFRLPVHIKEKYPDRPEEFKEIFRDNSGMNACRNLDEEIKRHLDESEYLIVVCSPNSANSPWVESEIEYFKKKRGIDHIYPFVVSGIVNANNKNKKKECIPEQLGRPYTGRAANISTYSFEHAIIEILADIIDVDVDEIWQRHVRLEEERKRKLKEQNDKLLIAQSRYLASRSLSLLEQGDTYTARMLALIALISDTQNPSERPVTNEAEIALRKALYHNNAILKSDSTSIITAMTYSDDGKYIISASDKVLYVWNLDSGHHKVLVGHKSAINTIVCKNNIIISGSDDSTIKIWDLASLNYKQTLNCSDEINNKIKHINSKNKREIHIPLEPVSIPYFLTDRVLGNFSRSILSLDFNNKFILSGHSDGSVNIWDPNKKTKPIYTFDGGKYHKGKVCWVCYNPKYKYMAATASDDGVVVIWNFKQQKWNYLPNSNAVSSIIFNQDGRKLVSAHVDNKIRIWDANTLQMIGKPMEGHSGRVLSLSLGPNKNSVISVSDDYTIRMWNIITQDCVKMIDYISLSNNPTTIKKDDFRYINQPIKGFVSYNTNNDAIATTIDDRNVYILSLKADFKYLPVLKPRHKCLSISEDGRYIMTYDGLLVKIDGYGTEIITRIKGSIPKTIRFAINTTNNTIATIDNKSNNIHILDVASGENKYDLVGHKNAINTITFSQDGKLLASTSYDNTIRIWNLIKQSSFSIDDDDVKMVVFNPVVKQIASTDLYGNISIWDYKKKHSFIVKYKNEITAMAFCNDGRFLLAASAKGEIHIIETKYNKDNTIKEKTIEVNDDKIIDLDFSPDNQHFLSASSRHICIWDLKTFMCIQKIDNCDNSMHRIHFSKDGDGIISVSLNGWVKIWDFHNLNNLIAYTQKQFADRTLTQEERKQYYLE